MDDWREGGPVTLYRRIVSTGDPERPVQFQASADKEHWSADLIGVIFTHAACDAEVRWREG